MSKPMNNKTPNPNNPSTLPSRYEIRKIELMDTEWATAIVAHSNMFHSLVWPAIYPENMTARTHKLYESMDYLIRHQIESGMSFGVYDTQYEFKSWLGRRDGGAVLWDAKEPSIEADNGFLAEAKRLEEQMDFPLVSVALSYDASNPLDMEKMKPLIEILPHFALVYGNLGAADKRDPTSWQPTGPGQVLFRNATSSKHEYEGQGLMSGLARWLMREAAEQGFRGIQIECLADAVTHVWSNPEEPFKGSVVSEFDMKTLENEEGKLVFAPAKQRATKCYVNLNPEV